jgi:CubicO group peptidase (beta-lactamase class C family)
MTTGRAIIRASSVLSQLVDREIPESERAGMRSVAEDLRTKYGIPGLSVAVARHGRMVYVEAFGDSDRDEGSHALTPTHAFRIASVSKPITSVTVMDLMESGHLSLDDHVFGRGGILGTQYGRQPYGRWVEDIQLKHLLTHTGGGWQNDDNDPMFRNRQMNHAELIAWALDNRPLLREPGTAYAYSNFGYCVLGRVIERVTKRPYAEHVRERILSRCGVTGMAIAGNTLADRAPHEVRYYGQGNEDPYTMNVHRMDSHGGWLATPSDLVTFAMHVDGFTTTPNILSAPTIQTMVESTVANAGYAKGWSVNQAHNWWHNGSLPGTATLMVRTQSGFCWAALANTRKPGSDLDRALDRAMWTMVRKVSAWRVQ